MAGLGGESGCAATEVVQHACYNMRDPVMRQGGLGASGQVR